MSRLFEGSSINGMEISNRFVRSATWEGMAGADGSVTPRLTELMGKLAEGGVGMIISGHTYVRPEGQASPFQLGIDRDERIEGLREMTTAVHAAGGKIVLQLAHAGTYAAEPLIGQPPLAVSVYEGLAQTERKEITIDDINNIVTGFADGAARAREAGFDGVQMHSAHGYLLSQFLSPLFNRRQDDYGGTIAHRTRIHLEVLRAIRMRVGDRYPVLIKMNCQDFSDAGLTPEDALQAAKMLAEAGLDAIEISGGLLTSKRLSPSRPGIDTEEKEAYFKEALKTFRTDLQIPLILVGGIRSFDVAEGLVTSGLTDYIAMSRPFIREPDLIHRWFSGDRQKARCISDNRCFRPGMEGKGIYCVTEAR